MKRIVILFVFLFSLPYLVEAGGIVTNANQSASYVRMYARDASLGIDAVYYNPAGLTQLSDGFYFSLNNQTIFQNKTITSEYPLLNNSEYKGDVSAPFFPGVYAVYKKNKLAISFGFNPVGGGGGAKYDTGLPSFIVPISNLVPMLQSSLTPIDEGIESATGDDPGFSNISGYSVDAFFEGTSVYFGYQLNASYELFEGFSMALGARYVAAKNTYNGHLKDVEIIAPTAYGGAQTAGDYLRLVASTSGLDATTVGTLQGTAAALDVQTADLEVDVIQKASAFTPIIGFNYSSSEKFNVALKYEFKTALEFENETSSGDALYPDGDKFSYDIPAVLAGGIGYKALDNLKFSTGFHYYFDKSADWEGLEEEVDNNYWEWALGMEYDITDKVLISAGYLRAQTGVGQGYQTDLSYSLSSNTVGFGGKLAVSPTIDMNLGVSYTMYEDGDKTITDPSTGIEYKELYDKDALIFAIGFDLRLGGGE